MTTDNGKLSATESREIQIDVMANAMMEADNVTARRTPMTFGEYRVYARFALDALNKVSTAPTPPASVQEVTDGMVEAIRDAFPHFSDDAPITVEVIKAIGKEYHEMVLGWEPSKNHINFSDQNGNVRSIIYDAGDAEAGISSGWTIDEDANWEVKELDDLTSCHCRSYFRSTGEHTDGCPLFALSTPPSEPRQSERDAVIEKVAVYLDNLEDELIRRNLDMAISARSPSARAKELRALKSTPSQSERDAWQTMENAPKARRFIAAAWDGDQYLVGEVERDFDDPDEFWWANTHGDYTAERLSTDGQHVKFWQPLPAPPSTPSQKEAGKL